EARSRSNRRARRRAPARGGLGRRWTTDIRSMRSSRTGSLCCLKRERVRAPPRDLQSRFFWKESFWTAETQTLESNPRLDRPNVQAGRAFSWKGRILWDPMAVSTQIRIAPKLLCAWHLRGSIPCAWKMLCENASEAETLVPCAGDERLPT